MKRFAVCVLLGLATTLPIVGCAEKPMTPAPAAGKESEAKAPEAEAKPADSAGEKKEGDAAAPANP